ncbi:MULTISPECIES: single-stranded-DNA-specific exonuclease RecJ [unclassified Acinetobacter]|uniref:single-stranded-DNA-specific exonuclease RecJ n=1 Tax=unclassified Acinetobacter TaxID=196816 RepID=UPI00293440F6|nr:MULTISPECIES: single-stranded-DNA-specific exonuclease RecJ [unclassified Acinetobacter]WOE30972.1 single-stranded-DNA-specific exonuclease RecJ [Acinetobacter sp. SAAs470]WOE39168.1 single-stranded-DNA-specific exonuclease RecJ [Acinetobacter sp. SAAs474]
MSKVSIQARPLISHPDLFQGVPAFMAKILAARGLQSAQELELKLKYLLAPSMKGLQQAVTLLDRAIDQGQQILIIGDYDADGATSTALMVLVLRQMGANVNYIVPNRFKYGYGLTPAIVDLAVQRFRPDLLVTVDNGISSHAGVEQAHAYGIQVIITDHHLTTKAIPDAEAVVNPNQLDCEFPSKALAGVGVAFYVLASLSTYRKSQQKSYATVTTYLDLVALGTYADVASLDYNNRILVDAGVKRIQQNLCRPGICALLDIAGRETTQFTAQDLGFLLGPRLNAAGRMDTMDIGIECLLADDFHTAYPLAQKLNQLNLERRQVESQMKQEALITLDQLQIDQQQLPAALIVFEQHWHQGVIGIVAGRLKEQFYRPAIVFAPDEDGLHLKGSARSIEGIHIRDAIEQIAERYPDMIRYFGGHAAAAGLTIKKDQFEAFKNVFQQLIQTYPADVFNPILFTDGELPSDAFQLATVDLIQQFGPWGQHFPCPVFHGVFNVLDMKWLKDQHLKLKLALANGQVIDAIAFNAIEEYPLNTAINTVYLVYELEKNVFKGQASIQLKIQHLNLLNRPH